MKSPTLRNRGAVSRALLKLDQPAAWPDELRTYLDAQHDLFLGWESEAGRVTAKSYDRAIYGLMDVLRPYAITGWHCTRLTDAEIDQIQRKGMQLPNGAMLARRIGAVVEAGQLAPDIARRLIAKNQADEASRRDKVWFCFFHPRIAGESGIGCFFRFWGGEGLYNCHENDAVTSPAIRRIGTPCLIEADVPIALLSSRAGLAFKVVRRFLTSRGYRDSEPVHHEDRINQPLPARCIRRVIRYPDRDFISLTGCDVWQPPL
jgi:hypothetical protein